MLERTSHQLEQDGGHLPQQVHPLRLLNRTFSPFQRSAINPARNDIRIAQVIGEGSRVGDRTRRIVKLGLSEELQIGNFLLNEMGDLDARVVLHADWDLKCVSLAVWIFESPDVVWAAVERMAAGVEDEGRRVFQAVDEGRHEMDVFNVDFHRDEQMGWWLIWLYGRELEGPKRKDTNRDQ